MTDVIPWVINAILIVVIAILARYLIKFSRVIIDVEDSLNESLDALDKAYHEMTKVAELPVTIDSPEIRHVLRQVKNSIEAVLFVSNSLAGPFGGVVEEEEEDTNG